VWRGKSRARRYDVATRLELARRVFATTRNTTHDHDGIGTTVGRSGHVTLEAKPVFVSECIRSRRQQELRYGESASSAALYVPAGRARRVCGAKQLQGKELFVQQSMISKQRGAGRGIQESSGGDHQAQQSLRNS